MNRLHYLDGWRGTAIVAVLLGHFFALPKINFGHLGVELFFILSGRLMAEILFERDHPLPDFFIRRVTRIYPAFVIFIAITATMIVDRTDAWEIMSCLTFTYNYTFKVVGISDNFNHIWSLCIEEHVYIILALIAYVHRRFGISAEYMIGPLALLMVANGAFRQIVLQQGYYDAYWATDVRGASILIGALAHLQRDRISKAFPYRASALVAGLAGFALNSVKVPDYIAYSLGTALLAVALVSLSRSFSWIRMPLETPILRGFGLTSFSIYLWQQPFYSRFHMGQLGLVTALGASLACGLLSYAVIERGLSRQLRAVLTARKAAIPETGQVAPSA